MYGVVLYVKLNSNAVTTITWLLVSPAALTNVLPGYEFRPARSDGVSVTVVWCIWGPAYAVV